MKRYHTFLALFNILVLCACSSTSKIKDGNTAYQFKQYENALATLPKEFSKAKTIDKKIDIAQKIVKSSEYTQQKNKQLEWSKILYDLDEQQFANNYLQALKINENYEEALTFLQSHTKKYKTTTSEEKLEIEKLENILKEIKEPQYKILQLSSINSIASDYGTFISQNNLYYTSHNQALKDNFTGNGFAQSYVANINNDTTFNDIKIFNIQNFTYHFAQIVFNKDKTEAFFTQCGTSSKTNNDYCKIYTSKYFNAAWTTPEKITFFNDSTDEAQPFLSPNDNELYFTSNNKEGYGGSDIYLSKRDKSGRFVQAYNLGSKVNSSANECFPTLSSDTTLYFSSNRKNGIGNLDIYQTIKKDNIFSTPILQNYPINTGADDFYYTPITENKLYISSNRKESKGKDDIFYIEKIKVIEPEKPKPAIFQLQVRVIENIYEKENNPNSNIIGTKNIDNANVFLPIPIGNGNEQTDANGEIQKYIYYKTKFKYKIAKENFLSAESSVNLENIEAKDGDTIVVKQTINLQRIYKNVEITLENIYYDYNKAEIRADAKQNLDTLIYILTENPSIKIELASHTDCRGSNTYNQQLSQKRAESVVNYLIKKGINKERLNAKGYGENALLENCECTKCSEIQHQKNRRTTFKILE